MKTFQANVAVFVDKNTVQHIIMPDGHRFIFFARGHRPELIDIDEPGEYEVDTPMVLDNITFPTAIAVVDLAHVQAWLELDLEAVDRMMDRVERTVAGKVRPLP